MKTYGETPEISFAEAIDHLGAKLRDRFARRDGSSAPMKITVACGPVDPLAWLFSTPSGSRYYWCSRDRLHEAACSGICLSLENSAGETDRDAIVRLLEQVDRLEPGMRMYGGLTFPDIDSRGASTSRMSFVLPRFEMVRTGGEVAFSVNVTREDDPDDLYRQLKDFARAEPLHPRPVPLATVTRGTSEPDRHAWREMFARAGQLIESGELIKIVLAKKKVIEFSGELRTLDVLRNFRDSAVNCYVFCRQATPTETFLGASPELLFERMRREVRSEALAGTVSAEEGFPANPRADSRLRDSPKEIHEQAVVVDYMHRQLSRACTRVRFDSRPSVLPLSTLRHLVTRFTGTLREGLREDALLTHLHPTPATAGAPRDKALRHIRALEPFSRGWYAGAIGWIAREQSEFAVAIRSGILSDGRLTLFSGAGIVADSDEQEEWDETERKTQPFMSLFTIQPHAGFS